MPRSVGSLPHHHADSGRESHGQLAGRIPQPFLSPNPSPAETEFHEEEMRGLLETPTGQTSGQSPAFASPLSRPEGGQGPQTIPGRAHLTGAEWSWIPRTDQAAMAGLCLDTCRPPG